MCGITGYLLQADAAGGDLLETLLAGVRQRGPDDEGGFFASRRTGLCASGTTERTRAAVRARQPPLASLHLSHDVALAHARYAIIDTSDDAHQPFVSAAGDLSAVFNGEVYNYVELRARLAAEGVACRTASDTEVLVEGFRVWGNDLWPRMNGFWAVAIFDQRNATLTIARDRMGVAPLYFRETQAGLYFSSLIRPLLGVQPQTMTPDGGALAGFLQAGMKDFGEDTVYADVKSFPPATVVQFTRDTVCYAQATKRRFWSLPRARWSTSDLSFDEAAVGFKEHLIRSVELRLRADVPIAFELSGGLDSSSVAACASILGHPIQAYTVSVPGRDELPFAQAAADRLGFTTRPLAAEGTDLVMNIDHFSAIMEEPYHSPNVYTSYRMRSHIKREGFAVVVSGSGGDELLGGYEYECWDAARSALWSEGRYAHVAQHAVRHYAGSMHRLRHSVRDWIGAIKGGLSLRHDAGRTGTTTAEQHRAAFAQLSFGQRVAFYFEVAQLPYYLRNGDHLTMSIPLEHRFPFLDVNLVEFGTQLPVAYLYRGGWSKAVLRRAFRDVLPAEVVWRREKMGFPFPLEGFLSEHASLLKPWAERARVHLPAGVVMEDWEVMQRRDPLQLWRLCSVGAWMEAQ